MANKFVFQEIFDGGGGSTGGSTGGSGDTDDSLIGTWVFNDELTPIGIEPDEWGGRALDLYFDYQVYLPDVGHYVKMDNFICYEWEDDEGVLYFGVSYYDNVSHIGYYWDDAYDGYMWLAESFKRINILTEPTDETFIAWLKANATKELNIDLSDISVEGTWRLNDEITLPALGDIPLKYSVFNPYLGKTVRMDRLIFGDDSLSYYGLDEGDGVAIDDVYNNGEGWTEYQYQTIIIREEWVDAELISWLRENAMKVGKPIVLVGDDYYSIPYWNCADGSMAIMESDSLVGKWEWKDTANPLDLSMFDLESRYVEQIEVHGYAEGKGIDGSILLFGFDTKVYDSINITIDNRNLYFEGNIEEEYQTFDIYTDAQYWNGQENQYITIEKFKEFIKANCNRLSGGNSLYIKEDGDWKYKCELAY